MNMNNAIIDKILTKHDKELRNRGYGDNDIAHFKDYLSTIRNKDLLDIFSIDKIINGCKKWDKKLQSQAQELYEQDSDIEVIDSKGGYALVKLLTRNAYQVEGKLMQNCVAQYFDKDCEIYSVRDNYNKPHITFEVRKNEIVQIRGKNNGRPIGKYIDTMVYFLKRFKFDERELVNQFDLELVSELFEKGYLKYLADTGQVDNRSKFLTINNKRYIVI